MADPVVMEDRFRMPLNLKCSHGVFKNKDGVSHYCQMCRPLSGAAEIIHDTPKSKQKIDAILKAHDEEIAAIEASNREINEDQTEIEDEEIEDADVED